MKICVTVGELLELARNCIRSDSCCDCALGGLCTGYEDLEKLCQIENAAPEITMKVNDTPVMPGKMPGSTVDADADEDRTQVHSPKIGGGRTDCGRDGG